MRSNQRSTRSVEVRVLEATPDSIKVRLPFVPVPVEMNYAFFHSRVQDGYFNLAKEPPEGQDRNNPPATA